VPLYPCMQARVAGLPASWKSVSWLPSGPTEWSNVKSFGPVGRGLVIHLWYGTGIGYSISRPSELAD
jgi:hypothetical protein